MTLPPDGSQGLSRLIDAAANRAREGARVIEDYLRFVEDDEGRSKRLKAIRHQITEACVLVLPYAEGLAARESTSDVGRSHHEGESKETLEGLLTANFKRAQEAVRSLEEFSKLCGPGGEKASLIFKNIRYELYTLEKEFPVSP